MIGWTLLAVPVGIFAGSASAFFLWALDGVTRVRWEHPWLLGLLPAGGLLIWLLYHRFGKSVEGGNNLIIDQIHNPGGGVPLRMAPLILVATLLTHLFGGSAGREGTAVQMGGSLAGAFGRLLRLGPDTVRMLLMAGVAAGFGSVFGTPLTGALFAMEVLIIGRMQYHALLPALAASVTGDYVCSAWGIHHPNYTLSVAAGAEAHGALELVLLSKIILAAIGFGLASLLFAELTHGLQDAWKRFVPRSYLRPILGGAVVIALVFVVGTRDYLGIGVRSPEPHATTLLSAFAPGGATPWSWWWKLLFTAVTLSCGFKGGEVTPLFFIGATLGNALAVLLGAPVGLFAGLGFIGVFAAATNTPVACTVMGVELFGGHYTTYFAVACFVAYFVSGHSGIYQSQRLGVPKRTRLDLPPEISLREAREWQGRLDGLRLARFQDFWSRSRLIRRLTASPRSAGRTNMKDKHHIHTNVIGKVRIYLKPGDRAPATGFWGRLSAKPVYRELIHAAKRDGLRTAVAYLTHYGFTAKAAIESPIPEVPNSHLTLCVEIIDEKVALEAFCRRHGALLQGATVIYKPVEHWDVRAREGALEVPAAGALAPGQETLAPV